MQLRRSEAVEARVLRLRTRKRQLVAQLGVHRGVKPQRRSEIHEVTLRKAQNLIAVGHGPFDPLMRAPGVQATLLAVVEFGWRLAHPGVPLVHGLPGHAEVHAIVFQATHEDHAAKGFRYAAELEGFQEILEHLALYR